MPFAMPFHRTLHVKESGPIMQIWKSMFCVIAMLGLMGDSYEILAETSKAQVSEMSKEEAERLHEERCRKLDQMLGEHPETFDRYGERGACLATEGRWEEALPYVLEQLERHPDRPGSYYNVSNTYYKLARYSDAIHEARRGLSLDRNNPVSHYLLAFLLEEAGESNEALSEYRTVLRWVEVHGEGTLYRRIYLTHQLTRERLQEAIQRLEKKGAEAKVAEEKPFPLPERKDIDRERKATPHEQHADYCQQIERQVQRTPRDPRRQLAWAFCRIHAGDLAGVEVAFLAALEQDAGNPYNYLFLAAHYQHQGKHDKAISELRRGLGQRKFGHSFNPVIQYLLAQAYEPIGRFKQARMLYEQVAKYAEKFPVRGKRYVDGPKREWYPTAALTPDLIQKRLAHVEEQLKGEEKQ